MTGFDMSNGRLMRAATVLLACGALCGLAFPAGAAAARGLVTGFSDPLYTGSDQAERTVWLDRTVEARAGLVRLNITWRGVVGDQRPPDPANPASGSYELSALDAGVRGAAARGLSILLTVEGAPAWAEGPGRAAGAAPGTWKPNPSDVAAFTQALAVRYSGRFDPDGLGPQSTLPAAQALQVWNEPNLSQHLTPQYEGKSAISPGHYREMLNSAYAAIKAGNPAMSVVTAGTAPYGDPPGGSRVRPLQFLRQMLCVKGCSTTLSFDVLAHNPINATTGPRKSAFNTNDAGTADLKRVVKVLRKAERKRRIVPAGAHPVWATELWWDSNPPNPNGFPAGRQARWLEEGLYLLWKGGASVVINLLVRDVTTGPPNVRAGNQAGIFFADGRPKPAFTAWRFPFVADRVGKRAVRAWGKAPVSGRLLIQRRAGKRWHTVRALAVSSGAVFTKRLRLRGRARLRATVAGETSLAWGLGR